MSHRLMTVLSILMLACGAESSAGGGPETRESETGDEEELMILADDPHGEAVVARLEGIAERALDAWEERVAAIMLETYDADGSGSIDTNVEVHRVVCEVWRTLDHELGSRSSETSLRESYGFAPGQVWRGSAIGIDVSTREHLSEDLLDCGVR